MSAYAKTYLSEAQEKLGVIADFGTRCARLSLADLWQMFCSSSLACRFERADPALVAGRSGTELAFLLGEEVSSSAILSAQVSFDTQDRGTEYWVGWIVAYYQWHSERTFAEIEAVLPVEQIALMYHPYHEMDPWRFCRDVDAHFALIEPETPLARRRISAGLSQNDLALVSGVSARTIQHYEQRSKNINNAGLAHVCALARALCCSPVDLVDRVSPQVEYATVALPHI